MEFSIIAKRMATFDQSTPNANTNVSRTTTHRTTNQNAPYAKNEVHGKGWDRPNAENPQENKKIRKNAKQ